MILFFLSFWSLSKSKNQKYVSFSFRFILRKSRKIQKECVSVFSSSIFEDLYCSVPNSCEISQCLANLLCFAKGGEMLFQGGVLTSDLMTSEVYLFQICFLLEDPMFWWFSQFRGRNATWGKSCSSLVPTFRGRLLRWKNCNWWCFLKSLYVDVVCSGISVIKSYSVRVNLKSD